MIKLQNTKTLKQAYKNYMQSSNYDLNNIYKSYSYEKTRAFDYCKTLKEKYNGNDLKIISGNTFTFSAGFTYHNEQDNKKIFCYITKNNIKFLNLSKVES